MQRSFINSTLAISMIAFLSCYTIMPAATSHCGLNDSSGVCPVARYKIIDLGTPKLEAAQLSKLEKGYSLAPVINNFSLILYNLADGAYLRDPKVGEYSLNLPGIKVYGHAINNEGKIIVSLQRPFTN